LVVPQLEQAAKSHDPEIGFRARSLMRRMGHGESVSATRKLMAIRTLGELRGRSGLPVLKTMRDSPEPFFAEYAGRAMASIEGKPYAHRRATRKELDEDLWLLPAGCGLVGQLVLTERIPVEIDKLLDDIRPPIREMGADDEWADKMAAETKQTLNALIGQIGNARVDAVTMGLADNVGDDSGFVVFVVRGRYNPQTFKALLEKTGVQSAKHDGVDVLSPDEHARLLLDGDRRAVFLAGPSPDKMPVKQLLAAIKTNGGDLKSNRPMVRLIESVDRTKALWLAAKMSAHYKQAPVLSALDTITLVAEQQGASLEGRFVAKGSEGKKLDEAVMMFDSGLKQGITSAKELQKHMSVVKPVIQFMESIKHKKEAGTVTVTGRIESIQEMMMTPMLLSFLFLRGIG